MAIVNGSLQLGYKDSVWFAANPTLVLKEGQAVFLEQTGTYKIGDGTSQLSALTFLGGAASVDQTIIDGSTNAVSGNAVFDGLATKQDTLVSGTNIKTINNTSLLGSGDIVISGGGGTILGTVPATAGQIPYTTGTLNTIQSSANLTYVSNILTLGTSISAGDTYFTDSDSLAIIARTTDLTVNTNSHGYVDATIFQRTNNGYANNAFTDNGKIIGSSNYDHHASFQSQFSLKTTGTTTRLYGLVDIPNITQGTLTNRYGFYPFDVTGAGTVNNNYGVFVPQLSKGSIVNYAIYTAGTTQSYFGGNLTANGNLYVGNTSGTGSLFIAGAGSYGATNTLNFCHGTPLGSYNLSNIKESWVSALGSKIDFNVTNGSGTNNNFKILALDGTDKTVQIFGTANLVTGTATLTPLKFTAGTNLTTPVNGAMEFDGTNLYFTVGGVRKTVTLV